MSKVLYSRQAAITFTPGSAGQSIEIAEATVFRCRARIGRYDKRRLGEGWDDWGFAGQGCSLEITVKVTKANQSYPSFPNGVPGSIFVYKDKSNLSGGYLKGAFTFESRTHSGSMGESPGGTMQTYTYIGHFCRDVTEAP